MTSHGTRYSLEEGAIFEGNYRIVREIGRGGFGVIYLAHQVSMDRPVALKVLKPEVGKHDSSARKRFLREVRIISKLRHPNTVTIHDFGETVEDVAYMVLEYIEGETLKDVIDREGAQMPLRSLALARQIAKSLAEAHRHEVIHRDLKPANVMLTDLDGDSDFVKVLDFGVARLRDGGDLDLTQGGVPEGERALIGTPRYMSPEQVKGEELTPASDLYSLGLILYEVLVGKPAVEGDTTMALIGQQISPEPLSLPSLAGLHPRIQDLLRRATDKSVDQRFQTGEAFTDAIDQTVQRLRAESGIPQPSQEFLAANKGTSPTSSAEVVPSGNNGSPPQFEKTAPQTPDHGGSDSNFEKTVPEPAPSAQLGEFGSDVELDAGEDDDWIRTGYDSEVFETPSHDYDTGGVEAVDVSDGRQKSGGTRNLVKQDFEDTESDLAGVPLSELPERPDFRGSVENELDDGPVETDEPVVMTPRDVEKQQQERREAEKAAEENIDLVTTGFIGAKLVVLGVLAVFFVYAAFVILGALVGELIEGKIRLAITAGLSLAIPLFTALGENSQKERFEVLERSSARFRRVFIGTAIFSAATAFVICFTAPVQVIGNLRADPNWMFNQPHVGSSSDTPHLELNQKLSYGIADTVHTIAIDNGWYGVISSDDHHIRSPGDDELVVPPQPTRPGTRQAQDDADQQQPDAETEDPDEAADDSPDDGSPPESDDRYAPW